MLKGKVIKKVLKIIGVLCISVVLLLILTLPLLQSRPVQAWLAQKVIAPYLSGELGTRVEIGSFYLRFNFIDALNLRFRNLVLNQVYVEDQQQDTLLYSGKLQVSVRKFDLDKASFHFDKVELSDGKLYLKTLADSSSNLDFVLNYFQRERSDTSVRRSPRAFSLAVDAFALNDMAFRYRGLAARRNAGPGEVGAPAQEGRSGIDFSDLDVSALSASISGLRTDGKTLEGMIGHFGLREKSGLVLEELSAGLHFSPGRITLEDLLLQTSRSRISDYLSFEFDTFSDFNDFTHKVRMEGNFVESRIASRDIALFAPGLRTLDLSMDVEGVVEGTLADLSARDMLLSLGRNSYLRGNYTLRGLPDLENTFIQADLQMLSTDKTDLDGILAGISSKPPALPAFLEKAGVIQFRGNFNGYYHDFEAGGELISDLGTVEGTAQMDFGGKVPRYEGVIQATDLDLGPISGRTMLGKTSFSAEVGGAGFRMQDLEETLQARIAYLEFRGYSYRNIEVNGKVDQKLFEGHVTIDDPSLNLDFDGLVNYNAARPEFRFRSTLQEADLQKLNFTRDSIVLSTRMESNFSGSSLEDIQGSIALSEIQLQTDTLRHEIDSLSLQASGSAADRRIIFRSDFLDGTMEGQFDITRLPSGVKSVLKQYLPSLEMGPIREVSELQSFNFAFQLKNLEPITAVFLPQLRIPDQGSFYGSFNSSDRLLRLAGGMETVEYEGIVFKNFILDEENAPEAIFVNATVDSIYFSDSLAVHNVNLSNYIRNDSLNFNIKLSNNSVNRMDINALIKVDSQQVAFSILPSDIVLGEQEWRIQESFRLRYLENDLLIEGFSLQNKDQELSINGAVSKSDSLPLQVAFTQLDIATFEPLLRQFNFQLGGVINGEATLSSVLDKPQVSSSIQVGGFSLNRRAVGELLISSAWDAQSQAVNFSVSLLKGFVPSMSISGEVETGGSISRLFADMEFNDAELVLLEPFLGGLVSDLRGQLTGRIIVEGDLRQPEINDLSYLQFKDAGLRVDYLKTYYRFSDRVTLSGGRLILNGLQLRDVRGNTATVTRGSIDLTNLIDPYLDIRLQARNFQALNTTAADNNYYYGTMYASGDFSFTGPISNMRIDINARTDPNSKFYLPLYNPEEVGKAEFVRFVSADDTASYSLPQAPEIRGVTLNFQLEVTDDTEVEIIFDKLAGDKIVGRGNAALQLTINSFGTFEIYGNYNVEAGEYVFTANNIFNKVFIIQPNSTIRFVGDPYQAQLDIYADYTLNSVDVGPLYEAANIRLSQESRVKTVTRINLTGTLENQNATFQIEFPNNRQVGSDTYSYLSNEDNRLTQTTWLLLANSFVNNNLQQGISEAGQATFTELLSGGLSSFINQLTGSSNFDISSRLGTESQEVSTSVRFFENRLIINGSFLNQSDAGNTSVNQRDEITQDIEIEYLLTRDGNIRAQLFRRTNVRDFGIVSARDEYKHGLGLSYRQEFNSFTEFFQNIFGGLRREEEEADSISAGNRADE